MDAALVIEKNDNANTKRAYIILMPVTHWRLSSEDRRMNGLIGVGEAIEVRSSSAPNL